MAICHACRGEGAFSYPCKDCNGTGVFTNNGHEKGRECRTCRGSGRFYPPWKGMVSLTTFEFPYVIRKGLNGETTFVHRCFRCKGTGQIKAEVSHVSYRQQEC